MQKMGRWKRTRTLAKGSPEVMKHRSCWPIRGLRTLYHGASEVPRYRGRNAWKEARMAVKRSGSPSPTEEEILMLELSELMAGALSLVKVHNRSRARAIIQKIAEERVERAALCVANISSGQGKSRRSCANKSKISTPKNLERENYYEKVYVRRKGGLTWHCCNLYGESIRAVREVGTVIGLEST